MIDGGRRGEGEGAWNIVLPCLDLCPHAKVPRHLGRQCTLSTSSGQGLKHPKAKSGECS